MEKRTRTLIIISIIFVLIVGGLVGWFYYVTREAETPDGTGGDITDRFPFGGGGSDTQPDGSTDPQEGEDTTVQPAPLFRQVSDAPVVGAVAITQNGTTTLFRYTERATGHVFEAPASTTQNARISNTTIPRLQNAVWADDGSYFIVRYLDENDVIKTFSGNVANGSVAGNFLTDDIASITLSPDNTRLLTVQEQGDGSAVIATDPDGGNPVQLYTSPLSGWRTLWPAENSVFLYPKATGQAYGSLYSLNLTTGNLERRSGAFGGFTASVNPAGDFALFSDAPERDSSFRLFVRNIETGTDTELAIRTLPEKCVWSRAEPTIAYCGVPQFTPAATYPDAWYQGSVSFVDSVWRIDAAAGTATQLFNPTEAQNREFDIVKPTLSPDDSHLLFINRNTGILWALDLTRI